MECSATKTLENRAPQWYGHVQRMPEHRLPKTILEWEPPERRRKERPALRWKTYIGNELIVFDINLRVGDSEIIDMWRAKIKLINGEALKKKKNKKKKNKKKTKKKNRHFSTPNFFDVVINNAHFF